MKKILVTGSSGFIGGKLAECLINKGRSVRLLLREGSDARWLLEKGAEEFRGDLTEPATLKDVLEDVEEVYHAAARLGRWKDTAEDLRKVNVDGVRNLMELPRAKGLRHFILISSAIVTGPVLGADEDYPCKPHTLYEATKYEGENLAVHLSKEKGIPLTVIRPTWTYGVGDPHKLALYRAIKKRKFVLLGGGENFTHPLFIDDLLEAIDRAAREEPSSRVYNIGGPRHVTTAELTRAIASAMGVKPIRLSIPIWFARAAAPVAEWISALINFQLPLTRSRVVLLSRSFTYSTDRARSELGYEPKVDLEEGLEKAVGWYREKSWL